jgi:Helicase associated domain
MEQGKKNQLTHDRVRLLNGLGFKWIVSTKERTEAKLTDVWDERYAECLQHYTQYGSVDSIVKDSPLHRWWNEQQLQYRNFKSGMSSLLLPVQIEQLERLGLSRDNVNRKDEATGMTSPNWDELYADLLCYRLNHGSFSVPDTDCYKYLHEFVNQQRGEYIKFQLGLPCLLNRFRVQALERVRFPWRSPGRKMAANIEATWEEMFGELLVFRLTYSSFEVPLGRNAGLHNWIQEQRQMYRCFANQAADGSPASDGDQDQTKIDLLRKRFEKLEDIAFPWN